MNPSKTVNAAPWSSLLYDIHFLIMFVAFFLSPVFGQLVIFQFTNTLTPFLPCTKHPSFHSKNSQVDISKFIFQHRHYEIFLLKDCSAAAHASSLVYVSVVKSLVPIYCHCSFELFN